MGAKLRKARLNLEDIILSYSRSICNGTQTVDEDLAEVKLLEELIKACNQIGSDEIGEELKKVELKAKRLANQEAEKKSVRDEEEYQKKIANEEQEAIEKANKAAERALSEAKEKKSERRWKIIDTIVKVSGIALPIVASFVMFMLSMKMEYLDNKIVPKFMKDVLLKHIPLAKH